MKTTIKEIDGNKIRFLQEGSKILQEFELEDWVKLEYVKLGDAEIEIKNNKVSFVSMIQSPAKPGPTGSSEKKKTGKWEDDIVTFEILLTKAHELKEHFSIKTKMLQLDVEKKFALFKAQVIVGENPKTKIGELEIEPRVFEGHGDATSENVTGEFIKPHFIRMAETRAIVRALRWYTNNGCAEEEK